MPGPMICNVALREVAAGLIGGGGGGLAGGGGELFGGGDATGACNTDKMKALTYALAFVDLAHGNSAG